MPGLALRQKLSKSRFLAFPRVIFSNARMRSVRADRTRNPLGLAIRPAGGWAWGSGGRACPNTGGSTLSCSRPWSRAGEVRDGAFDRRVRLVRRYLHVPDGIGARSRHHRKEVAPTLRVSANCGQPSSRPAREYFIGVVENDVSGMSPSRSIVEPDCATIRWNVRLRGSPDEFVATPSYRRARSDRNGDRHKIVVGNWVIVEERRRWRMSACCIRVGKWRRTCFVPIADRIPGVTTRPTLIGVACGEEVIGGVYRAGIGGVQRL